MSAPLPGVGAFHSAQGAPPSVREKQGEIRGRGGARRGRSTTAQGAECPLPPWGAHACRPAYLLFWSTVLVLVVLPIVSIGGVGAASVLRAGGGLCPRGVRVSTNRRSCWWLWSATVGLAVVALGGSGVSAAVCTGSKCCNVAIPLLPLTTTTIDDNDCKKGT